MSELPERWDPRKVALNRDKENAFLLRPGQILAGPGDAADVAKVLTGWKPAGPPDVRRHDVHAHAGEPGRPGAGGARRDRARSARPPPSARRARRASRPTTCSSARDAITLTGEPRVQGGPGLDRPRRAAAEDAPAAHHAARGDGKGVRIAVLDTGIFNHQWLDRRPARRPAPPTSGTSTTTATPTPSPATARSSPG